LERGSYLDFYAYPLAHDDHMDSSITVAGILSAIHHSGFRECITQYGGYMVLNENVWDYDATTGDILDLA